MKLDYSGVICIIVIMSDFFTSDPKDGFKNHTDAVASMLP